MKTIMIDVVSTEKKSEKTMTVKEIADAMGVSYSAVYRVVSKLFPNKMQNGKTAFLNEQEVACVSKELKGNYHTSQMTFSAGEKVKNTSTELEVLANYKAATDAFVAMLNAKNAELKALTEQQARKIEEDKPLVDFAKAVTDSKDCIDIGQAAKILNVKGIGRNKLFEILRKENVLDRKNQPYQKFVDNECFRVIETSFQLPDGTTKINLKTLVFQKGLKLIREILKDYEEGENE